MPIPPCHYAVSLVASYCGSTYYDHNWPSALQTVVFRVLRGVSNSMVMGTPTESLLQYMTDVRRSLHQTPELAWEEVATAEWIRERLTELGQAGGRSHRRSQKIQLVCTALCRKSGGVPRSGLGRELGPHGIHEFVNAQQVWVG